MLILFLGPSGAGKSRLIADVLARMPLTRIIPDMTRRPRTGETEKRSITLDEFNANEAAGTYVAVNNVFGNLYGTPRGPVEEALAGSRPTHVLDYPLSDLPRITSLGGHLAIVAVMPPSREVLTTRLYEAGRQDRLGDALRQLSEYEVFISKPRDRGVEAQSTIINDNFEAALSAVLNFIKRTEIDNAVSC